MKNYSLEGFYISIRRIYIQKLKIENSKFKTIDKVKYLINRNINYKNVNKHKQNALLLSCYNKNYNVAKFLLNMDIDY